MRLFAKRLNLFGILLDLHYLWLRRKYSRSKIKRKTSFPFEFCSLIRTFDFIEIRLHFGNTKKNEFSFGISLAFSYLRGIKNKTKVIYYAK